MTFAFVPAFSFQPFTLLNKDFILKGNRQTGAFWAIQIE
jgi:hypothetical protein